MLVRVLPPHKNIVRVPAHLVPPPHEWESGSPYVPLEFARDGDLMDAAIELRRAGCTYRPRAVAELGRQLAEALRHCHAAGVYHRDVKPDNVLVFRAEGVLRLADFGCATTEARPLDCSTTECYAAPEVLRCRRNGRSAVVSGGEASASGRAARGYDAAAADVWSLGISLFALLAGRCPWQCATPHNSFFERYVTSGHFDAAVLAGASAGCEDAKAMDQMLALVQRMLSVEPTSRPTMEHLAGELAALASAVPHAPVTVNPSAPADAEGMDLVPSAASQALSLPTNGGDAVDIAALSDDSDDDDDETSAPARAELHTAEATADTPMRRAADFGITPVVRSASYVAGTCLESVGDVDEDLDGDTSDDDVPMSTSRVVDTGARV